MPRGLTEPGKMKPMPEKRVMIVGSGVAGMSAALDLAAAGVAVDVLEQSEFAGGQGIRLSCKATDACVKCGACMADDRLGKLLSNPRIRLWTAACIQAVSKNSRFVFRVDRKPVFVDEAKCSHCHICLEQCPAEGAILQGTSGYHRPFYALSEAHCLHFKDKSCTACQESCPTGAIRLDAAGRTETVESDAVIVAAGFSTHRPHEKPYGWGLFPDVVTTAELEAILKRKGRALRPSDGTEPGRIAFIQCVGSRDAKIGHLWCSIYCCGSALRMARLIRHRQPESQTTVFYIDIQNFGRDFERDYRQAKEKIRMIRSIPGDIYPSEKGKMKLTYLDEKGRETVQEDFDLVVLSVAMTPPEKLDALSQWLPLKQTPGGFLFEDPESARQGVFTAGAATGPMTLAEAAASGSKAARQALRFLETT